MLTRYKHRLADLHYCYFIRSGKSGPIKIGVASDVKRRMANLQCGNPEELKFLFAIQCRSRKLAESTEYDLHKFFAKHRMFGEWFSPKIAKRLKNMRWYNVSQDDIVHSI